MQALCKTWHSSIPGAETSTAVYLMGQLQPQSVSGQACMEKHMCLQAYFLNDQIFKVKCCLQPHSGRVLGADDGRLHERSKLFGASYCGCLCLAEHSSQHLAS